MSTTYSDYIRGDVDISRIPPIDEKPKLTLGYLSDVNVFPVIVNFSHVVHWMYANFMTRSDIEQIIREEVRSRIREIIPSSGNIEKINASGEWTEGDLVEKVNQLIDKLPTVGD